MRRYMSRDVSHDRSMSLWLEDLMSVIPALVYWIYCTCSFTALLRSKRSHPSSQSDSFNSLSRSNIIMTTKVTETPRPGLSTPTDSNDSSSIDLVKPEPLTQPTDAAKTQDYGNTIHGSSKIACLPHMEGHKLWLLIAVYVDVYQPIFQLTATGSVVACCFLRSRQQ